MSSKKHLSRGDRVSTPNGHLGVVLGINGGGRFAAVKWDNGMVSDYPYELLTVVS